MASLIDWNKFMGLVVPCRAVSGSSLSDNVCCEVRDKKPASERVIWFGDEGGITSEDNRGAVVERYLARQR